MRPKPGFNDMLSPRITEVRVLREMELEYERT